MKLGLKRGNFGLKKTQPIIRDNGTAVWAVAISQKKPYNLTMTYLEPVPLVDEPTKPILTLSVQSIMLERGANPSKSTEIVSQVYDVAIDK